MRCLSLKAGLSWLIAVVLLSTLFVNIAIEALHAGPRVRAEAESNSRLTLEMVTMTIAGLRPDEDPAPTLRKLFGSLGALRHVDIRVLANSEGPLELPVDSESAARADVPMWFVTFVGAARRTTLVPIVVDGREYGRVAMISNPLDELAEVWSDIEWLAAIGLAITLGILALVLALVRFSLAPFDALHAGLVELESGKSGVNISVHGASEFRTISAALNSLAATLDHVKAENRALLSRLMQLQETERREIARDLHDDAGPALFSIRASAVALQDALAADPVDIALGQRLGETIEKASGSLQTLFRDMLGRLRTNDLAEFGLNEALARLAASWREKHPETSIDLTAPHDLSALDEGLATTAYRIVQEGLTNVFRHAMAGQASIEVFYSDARLFEDSEDDRTAVLKIMVEDDGQGLPERIDHGLGLIGMRERVEAVGGTISVESRQGGGTRIIACLPLGDDEE